MSDTVVSKNGKYQSDTLQLIRELLPNRWLRWGAVLLFWTVVALISTLHWRYYPMGDYPYTWWELLRAKELIWFTWGLFTPVILYLAARFKIEREKLWRNILWLVALSIPITVLHLIIYTKIVILNIPAMKDLWQFQPMFDFVISRHSTYYYLAFWATVGLEHALGFYRRYHERELLTSRLESRLARARLDRLRDQLHPHFLFNTLNTISSMILKDKKILAYDTLTSLSELLRISLERSDQQWSTLHDELEFSRLYLELLSARFPDNLSVEWDIVEGTQECAVPCLLLQPLVENCITHGAVGEGGKGWIRISAIVATGGRLRLQISNDVSSRAGENGGGGLGLSHIDESLEHFYRDDYSFTHAAENGSYEVAVELPFRKFTSDLRSVSAKD